MTIYAIYTRWSSDMQKETSTEDQARNCRQHIEREGGTLGPHFKDEAISGSTDKRPGYQAMLAAAKRKEFNVLVLDKLSRFSRELGEQEHAMKRLIFHGTRVIAVGDGYDSSVKGSTMVRQINGAMNERFNEDLAYNVHRGLTGQVRKGYWGGGRCYGYDLVRETDQHRLNQWGQPAAIGTRLIVNEEQATIVRLIFERYASGCSARAIASELNERDIPSPGAKYKRKARTKNTGKWLDTAISSDKERELGILNNQLYRGIYRWNRSQWVRNPDTKIHVPRKRPESEWVTPTVMDPALRIVSEELWDRVKARQKRMAHDLGEAVSRGIVKSNTRSGRGPKYLLSGVLTCADCGRPLNICDAYTYRCPAYTKGGPAACPNSVPVKRAAAERLLLRGITDEFLSPANVARLKTKVRRILAERQVSSGTVQRELEVKLAALNTEIERYVDAIAGGLMSPTLRAKLEAAEAAKGRVEAILLQTPAADRRLIDMIPGLVGRFAEIVEAFEARAYVAGGPAVARARADIKHLVGAVPVVGEMEGGRAVPYAVLGGSERLLLVLANEGNQRLRKSGRGDRI